MPQIVFLSRAITFWLVSNKLTCLWAKRSKLVWTAYRFKRVKVWTPKQEQQNVNYKCAKNFNLKNFNPSSPPAIRHFSYIIWAPYMQRYWKLLFVPGSVSVSFHFWKRFDTKWLPINKGTRKRHGTDHNFGKRKSCFQYLCIHGIKHHPVLFLRGFYQFWHSGKKHCGTLVLALGTSSVEKYVKNFGPI